MAILVAASMAAVAPDASMARRGGKSQVLRRTFSGPNGLITNAYATWTPNPLARRSHDWSLDSGSLFRLGNAAWTGHPTCGRPDVLSQLRTGSDMLRVHLLPAVPRNVQVTFALRVNHFTPGCSNWRAAHWNSISVYLRRVDGDNFYTADVSARDGRVYIEKKIEGRYRLLAGERGHTAPFHRWEKVGGSVRTNRDGSVTVSVIRHGEVVLSARDRGRGGPPITAAGRSGFRSDNVEFRLDNFTVSRLR